MSVLADIVDLRRSDLPELYAELAEHFPQVSTPQQVYALTPADFPARKNTKSLREAVLRQSRRRRPALILECKAASPSKGQLASNYDPAALAGAYAQVATGISVLTEGRHFGGSFADLAKVRAAVDLPILAKDFIVDPVQIALAYLAGANAVLLMLSVLDDETYLRLRDFATGLGLDSLTEVATEAEAARARDLGANLVDINHRDLHTLQLDMNRVRDLAPRLGEDAVIVAASGMSSLSEITARRGFAHGFLVGSALSGAPNLAEALNRLSGVDISATSRVSLPEASSVADERIVKVCGITTDEAAEALEETGIEYAGINLVAASPRFLNEACAANLMASHPSLKYVAITRAHSYLELSELAEIIGRIESLSGQKITALQLHSYPQQAREETLFIGQAKALFPAHQIWRALPAAVETKILEETLADPEIETVILDSPKPGSGQHWSWSDLPLEKRRRLVVAGGVGIENAAQILDLGYRGIDANSALEVKDGEKPRKDPNLIKKFANQLNETNTEKETRHDR